MAEETPYPVENVAKAVESVIFVAENPVPVETLARVVGLEVPAIEEILARLASDYESRGFRLNRMRDQVQLVSAPETAGVVAKFLGLDQPARLSPAALETLAIIAYRQPLTRRHIEAIRGVNSDGVIHNLLARGLIEEVGRLETVGHPIQYGTTFEFLQYFGLSAVGALPPLQEEGLRELARRELGARIQETAIVPGAAPAEPSELQETEL